MTDSTIPSLLSLACTLCQTDSARAVRAAVLGPDFWQNLAFSALPIAVLIATALFVHGRPPAR